MITIKGRSDLPPAVIIVGANFAGLKAAMSLPRKLSVTVIDKKPWFECLPNIHQLLSGMKTPAMLRFSNEAIVRRAGHQYLSDTVTRIFPDKKQVLTLGGRIIHYDHCIVAAGGGNNTYGVKGADNNAFPFKTAEQCHAIGRKLKKLSETRKNFFVVLAGAGPEGVEALGEILRRYREHKGLRIRVVEKNARILQGAPAEIASEIKRHCNRCSVEFLTLTSLEKVTPHYVILSDGKKMKSDLTIWNGGIRPRVFYSSSGFTKTRDQWPQVDEFLRHTQFPDVYFTGDSAGLPYELSKQAYHAIDMGYCAAKNISRSIAGKSLKAYKPSLKPLLISFGDLDTFLVAGKIAVAGPALSSLKEAIFQMVMTQFDPSGLLMKPFNLSTRAGNAAFQLLFSGNFSFDMIRSFGNVRVLR